MYLSILIPCLNEEKTISYCINKAKKFLNSLSKKSEILIVDNGSTDRTINIAKKNGARVIVEKRRGYGSALIKGIKNCKGKYIIMGDADGSYDFSNLNPFIRKFEQNFDVVCGNRFKGGIEKNAMPFLHKYIGNPILSYIGRLFFSLKLGDFHCGLRGFNRSKILSLDLQTTGMEFASEMLVKSGLQNLKICEVNVKLHKDKRDRKPHLKTWSDGWRHLTFLFFHAPKWLFFIPGLSLLSIGLFLYFLTIKGTFMLSARMNLDIFTLYAGSIMILIGSQLCSIGIFAKLYNSKNHKIFDKVNKIFLSFAIICFLFSIFGVYFSLNYWYENDYNFIDYKILGRYLITSGSLLLISFQLFINLLLFNFLRRNIS